MRFIHFLINTNIFIALCAVALTMGTQVQLGLGPALHPYLFLIFFATLFEYNLHRLVTMVTNPEALSQEKHSWMSKHRREFILLAFLSVLGFLVAIVLAKKEVLMALAPVALITVFYSLPVFKKKRLLFRLRELPFFKIFIISFVWSAATIFLPVIHSETRFDAMHLALVFAERFLFIFAITIPFDIRDMKPDAAAGLKTIPVVIGEKRSIVLSLALLGGFMVTCAFHYLETGMQFVLAAMVLSAGITMYSITSSRMKKMKFYYYGILDGTMLLQGSLLLAAYYLDKALA